MSSSGTKVTTDPRGLHNPKVEHSGIVTSDSLAAESIKSGGHFAENDPNRAVMNVPSKATTANNTDTSGATVLPPAPDAASRHEAHEATTTHGHGKQHDIGEQYTTPADERNARLRAGDDSGPHVYNTKTGSGQNVGVAPSYVTADVTNRVPPEMAKPKGKNLHEGGFDSDAPNASFSGDIGGKNDPGRLAEQKFAGMNAQSANDAGSGPRQKKVDNENPYGALKEDAA